MINPEKYIGQKQLQKCGMEATIIAYNGSQNITVEFTDGTIVEHKQYTHFKRGSIQNPSINIADERIGLTNTMRSGGTCTIINYINSSNITVQFDDGAVKEHTLYAMFQRGQIQHPNLYTDRIGKVKMMNCGMECEIVAYYSSADITVKFTDGTVVEHCKYDFFKRGHILNPSIKTFAEERLGQSNTTKNGLKYTIVEYINSNNIIVEFEDGSQVKTSYKSFLKGYVNLPEDLKRQGKTLTMNCGIKGTVIEYKSNKNVTVQFEDGSIVKTTWHKFIEKNLISPKSLETRIGEKRMMPCGMEAEIIDNINNISVKIRFSDGEVTTCSYKKFLEGQVRHSKPSIVGTTIKSMSGFSATILESTRTNNTIQFADGVIRKNVSNLKRGEFCHPNIKRGCGTAYGVTFTGLAFTEGEDVYYKIIDKDGVEDIKSAKAIEEAYTTGEEIC